MLGSVRVAVEEFSKAEQLEGKLDRQEEEKLMRSVVEHDEEVVKEGKLIADALNQGFSSFVPDAMFNQLIKNYSLAERIYGESMIRLLSGYNPNYVRKNIRIPEFQREVKKNIYEKMKELSRKGLISKDGTLLDKGIKLASFILYTEELDNLLPKGIMGEKIQKRSSIYGEREDVKEYRKGDRYKDLALKQSIKRALRRGHTDLLFDDLKTFQRQSKGSIYLIYGMDASGSMKGDKMEASKKAGIALAFKAVGQKDKVGLIVFGTEIKKTVDPTLDFMSLLDTITRITASKETNITETIRKSLQMFPNEQVTKHLILLTDALPTIGKDPQGEVLEAVSLAVSQGVTISVIGISLDKQGKELAEKIVRLGNGRLYVIRDLKNLDKIVLEDYYSVI